MKKLLVVAVLVGLAAVVYAKVIRSTPAESACERLDTLCGGEVNVGECKAEFAEAEKIVGEKVIDKATDCIDDANTCMEAIGCMGGAATHAIDELEKGFERSRKR
jgi:hypothetical protein